MKKINAEDYRLKSTDQVITPALVYYPEIIAYNTDQVIKEAGGTSHIWAHVKTFKSAAVVRLLQQKGIRRFKCATIAEAEMAALCEAEEILVAYPLVGPNVERFLKLVIKYPRSHFWAIGDNPEQIRALGKAAASLQRRIKLLVDVNIGMDRTGVSFEQAPALYEACAGMEGIAVSGLHCFSGNFKIADHEERKALVEQTADRIMALRERLKRQGYPFEVLVLSGTPVLNCYREYEEVYLCPGTAFIMDMSYYNTFPDYDFLPAAVILTRVISTPVPGNFTLDLGYKSIAADPKGSRGVILGYEDAECLFQCEEHWTFHTDRPDPPKVGELLYVLPTHVCPTTTYYPEVLVGEKGSITGAWEVTARNRRITV